VGVFLKTDLQKQAINVYRMMRELNKRGEEDLQIALKVNKSELKKIKDDVARTCNGADFENREFLDELERILILINREQEEKKEQKAATNTQSGATAKNIIKTDYYDMKTRKWVFGEIDPNSPLVKYNKMLKRYEKY